jgi:hypothetical protein
MNTKFLFTVILILLSLNGYSTTYYVSTTGNDSNNGTSTGTPYKTITKAVSVAVAGDIIYVRGGTYVLTSTISISKSGGEGNPISLMSYPGDKQPLLDYSTQAFGSKGISLSGNYWYIKGIRIKGAGDNGIYISGSYNKIEFCSFSENRDSGMQLSGGASNNQIINCDSYFNADPTDYGDADGFAVKMDVGTGNYFYGCRSWMNVDDGWDGYLRPADDVTTTLENCWTWRNGYFKDGTDAGANANGNGFKMGGSDDKTLRHNFILRNCLSFYNKAKNFDQNNNKGSMTLYNCTSFGGAKSFSISVGPLAAGKTATITNCVALNSSNSLGAFVVELTNSWLAPFTTTVDDFTSTDTTGISKPRFEDGSLPNITFMHLVQGSDLIDAGTNVGIPFLNTKPDIGFWEYGTPLTQGTPLSVGEIQNQERLKIYPSLTNRQLFVAFDNKNISPQNITIFAITGQNEKNFQISNTGNSNILELNVSNLPSGLYICRITVNGKSVQGKFVKQ